MDAQIRLFKIAKHIISDIVLRNEKEFKKYLEDHPNYRKDTVFIVDGVKRKAPKNNEKGTSKKKTDKLVESILRKHSFLMGEKGMVNIYKKILEKEGSLDKIPEKAKEAAFNFVNSRLGEGHELDRKTFDALFENGLESYKKKLAEEEQRKKEEELKKQKQLKEEREKKENEGKQIIDNEILGTDYSDELAEKLFQQREKERERDRQFLTEGEINSMYPPISKEDFKKTIFVSNNPTWGISKEEALPTFRECFEEANKKLAQRGLPPIAENVFRERYNDLRFPLFNPEEHYHDTTEQMNDFCEQHICVTSKISDGRQVPMAHIINGVQKIKREFPDLFRTKWGAFGVDLHKQGFYEVDGENFAACVFRGGGGMDIDTKCFTQTSEQPNYNGYKLGGVLRGKNYTETMETIAIHEMGHMVEDYFYAYGGGESIVYDKDGNIVRDKYDNKYYEFAPRSNNGRELKKKLEDLYDESMKNGDIYKLTWYASTRPSEFFAEIFALYYTDRKNDLPPNILTKLEEIIKVLKSGNY